MYRLAPSRCARRPKQPANRSRNLPSRSSTARAVDSDKSMPHQHTKLLQKSPERIIGSLVRKNGSDKVLLMREGKSQSPPEAQDRIPLFGNSTHEKRAR